MNAKKRGNRYRAEACKTIDGKKIRKSFTADTKAEAEMLATVWQNRAKLDETHPTVGKALDTYIERYRVTWSPRTVRENKLMAERIKASLDRVCVEDMDTKAVQNYLNELALTKSPKTVRNMVGFLVAALTLDRDVRFKLRYPERPPVEYSIPDANSLNLLLKNSDGILRLAIALGSKGLRRGEIAALKYKDVLYDLKAVYIHSDMVKNEAGQWEVKKMPKTAKSVRRVLLPPEVMAMIGEGDPEDFIINRSPEWITKHFIKLRDSLGMSCRFHDLRHFMVSYNHANGIPDQYTQEQGGWSTDNTLKSVYRNSLPDKAVTFARKSNEAYSKEVFKDII